MVCVNVEGIDVEIVIIAALAEGDRVIGHSGQMPWHLPEDLARFQQLTTGHPIIMGRTTWEFGLGKRTLPQRHNIVVSHSLPLELSSSSHGKRRDDMSGISVSVDTRLQVVRSLPNALTCACRTLEDSPLSRPQKQRIFIIGGASIYQQTLHWATHLELTIVHGVFEGDTFFPDYTPLLSHFECVKTQYQSHTHPPCTYLSYQRLSPPGIPELTRLGPEAVQS